MALAKSWVAEDARQAAGIPGVPEAAVPPADVEGRIVAMSDGVTDMFAGVQERERTRSRGTRR
jgi:hypothetical protein